MGQNDRKQTSHLVMVKGWAGFAEGEEEPVRFGPISWQTWGKRREKTRGS